MFALNEIFRPRFINFSNNFSTYRNRLVYWRFSFVAISVTHHAILGFNLEFYNFIKSSKVGPPLEGTILAIQLCTHHKAALKMANIGGGKPLCIPIDFQNYR